MASTSRRRGPRLRLHRPRVTFATRLLLGGFALSLAIIAAVSAFLLVSSDQQTRSGAESEASSRAQALTELVEQVAAPQARFAAHAVAGLPEMASALGSATPATAVAALLTGPGALATSLPGDQVAVFDARGTLLATGGAPGPPLSSALPEVQTALGGIAAEGIDLLDARTPADDFADPVRSSGGGLLGVVVYSMPLPGELMRLLGAVGAGYIPVLATNARGAPLLVLSGSPDRTVVAQTPFPTSLGEGLGASAAGLAGFTAMPGTGEVAMALRGLGSAGARPAVYVGVETPLSRFQGGQTTDELTVVWLAITALLVTWLAVLLFVNRFVRRPVAQLSSGVARIAGGDYSSDIPVRSRDELGALARQINRLRAQIEGNIRHVDHAVTRLDEVSRALTTTTTGVGSLESAVCAAAASIAGPGASAWLLERAEDGMRVRASSAGAPAEVELPPAVVGDLLAGRVAGWAGGAREILAIPMTLRDEVAGALAITAPAAVGDADSRALSALANNAVIALANTRLFEAERETVRRLRELDAMKSDFLATAQHELRTPLTAILGHLELLRILWPTADEAQRLGSIEAVELAARQLSEMLETVIDLSLVSADHLRLQRQAVEVASAVRGALADLERRHPRGLPVEVSVDVPAGLEVDADPERLRQVVRCLVDNAVKFNRPTGRVGVAARADEAGRACVITVSDTGIGIDPSLQERVFERFFQVESGGTRAYGGMGVGLALVKMLAEAHGATVRLASQPGAGTTVELLWPRPGETTGLEGSDRDIDLTGGRPQAAPPRAAGRAGTDPGGARPST